MSSPGRRSGRSSTQSSRQEDLDISSLDETTFIWLVEKIFARIDLSGRWSATPTWGTEDFKSDELLMFSLGLHLISFLISLQKYWNLNSSDQLYYGVRLLAEKHATNYGDGLALVSFIRDAIGEYHLQGKVRVKANRRIMKFFVCRPSTEEVA